MAKMGCASCGGSMKKGGTKKPVMRGGGKIATMKTPTYKIGGKTTKKMMTGGATEICKDGDPKCKDGKRAPGTRPNMTIGDRLKNAFSPGRIKTTKVKKRG
jgi:hypothetical protein